MEHTLSPQEDATIQAFIVRERRDRFLELLANPKKRRKIMDSLAHPHPAWFDSRYVVSIPPSQGSALGISKLLHSMGAPRTCWAISEDAALDRTEVDLDATLAEIVGGGMGTILCCVPGKLAYVESEDGRFILERK
jgi:hypothetical protein